LIAALGFPLSAFQSSGSSSKFLFSSISCISWFISAFRFPHSALVQVSGLRFQVSLHALHGKKFLRFPVSGLRSQVSGFRISPSAFRYQVSGFGPGPRNGRVDIPIDKLVPKWHRAGMATVLAEPRKRITARVSDSVRDTLEQAAELLGATVNQFVVQTAYAEAQRVIERESVIRLSQADAHKILGLLDHPPKPNQRLKAAVKTYQAKVRA
jgi:uncharacterized protein (DUF1778 family)